MTTRIFNEQHFAREIATSLADGSQAKPASKDRRAGIRVKTPLVFWTMAMIHDLKVVAMA
jgi:hypothetical protein